MTRLPVLPLPRTRAECAAGPRPCPHTSCRYHLSEFGPDVTESCALDVAEEGGLSLGELSKVLGKPASSLQRIEERGRAQFRERWVA